MIILVQIHILVVLVVQQLLMVEEWAQDITHPATRQMQPLIFQSQFEVPVAAVTATGITRVQEINQIMPARPDKDFPAVSRLDLLTILLEVAALTKQVHPMV
jgi:hypothetical protein